MNYDAKIETGETALPVSDDPLAVDGEDSRRSRKRAWIFAIAAAIVLIGLFLLMHRKEPAGLSAEDASQTPIVTVISPGRVTIPGRINATGTLAARREEPVGVQGEGGKVVRVLVEPGQWVGAGQVLAVIDRSVQAEQTSALAAQIQVAQADARLAQANLDRALKLVDRGFISKADVDRLTATRDGANARVRVAQAQLGEMQARVRQLNVVAPSAGLVLERNVEPGQVVSAGSGVLFRLAKGGEMELLAQLSEEDLARAGTGTAARVTPVGTDKSFTGEVWQVSPVIDPQNRQGTARVALSYAPELRPGGFASAEIVAGTLVAPLLPESAVLADARGSYVYIVDGNNKVVRRPIRTGAITDSGIVVTEGLSGGERIVRRAGAFLSEGETVRPKAGTAPGR
ncbi:MAG: efflux RND transporter periplasmic adaptor subunit [Novosphingobium sp.]|nr:efflux RND transporter periplasmic adaptor subunit [Novosphingobium sp.]